MIEIPKCLRCGHFNNGKCKAFPEGASLVDMARSPNDEECAKGIEYKRGENVQNPEMINN